MRTSINQINISGALQNGYDYKNQAWVINGVYVACNHPFDLDCSCYGKEHEGEICTVSGN